MCTKLIYSPRTPCLVRTFARTTTAATVVSKLPIAPSVPLMDSSSSTLPELGSSGEISITQRMHELYMARLQRGVPSIHVGFGQAVMPVYPPMKSGFERGSANTRYSLIAGEDRLREAFARRQSLKLGLNFGAEQVFVGPGTKPLLFALFGLLPGDVLLPRPSWPAYAAQVKMSRKDLIWVETDPYDRHHITVESLDYALESARSRGSNPRILLLCSPNSPTGGMMTPAQIEAIASWCRERGVYIVSDEIYSDLVFDLTQHPFASPAQFFSEGTIITHGISKTFSAGGWRMGGAIVPVTATGQKLVLALQSLASDLWSCTSNAVQEAAFTVYDTQDSTSFSATQKYIRQCAVAHGHCALRLAKAFNSMGLPCPTPRGGFYVYPSFQPFARPLRERFGVRNSVELSMWLIEKFGIITVAGSACGEEVEGVGAEDGEPGGRFRLRIATSMLMFPEEERDTRGWQVLEQCEKLEAEQLDQKVVDMPLLDRCIAGFEEVIESLS